MKMTELDLMMDILHDCSVKYSGPVWGYELVDPCGNVVPRHEYGDMLYVEYEARYDEEPSDACIEVGCVYLEALVFSLGRIVSLEQTFEDGRVLRIHSNGKDMPDLEVIKAP
jgi:hypothetical protein